MTENHMFVLILWRYPPYFLVASFLAKTSGAWGISSDVHNYAALLFSSSPPTLLPFLPFLSKELEDGHYICKRRCGRNFRR